MTGIVSGTIWVIIRQLANQLEKKRSRIEEKLSERTDLMRALETSLTIGTKEAMQDAAKKLWQFATAKLVLQ